jgi:hypothetical protein
MKRAPASSGNSVRALAAAMVLMTSVVVAAETAGCSAGGGGMIPDAHYVDAYEVSLDLPAGCPPAVGNEKGVGKPCTRGGHECGTGSNLLCTCDDFFSIRLDGVPCICTLVVLNTSTAADAGDLCASQPTNSCGNTASCCAYMTIGTYCVPNICLPGGECPVVGAPP